MTESDFRYILLRLGYRPEQPAALALYRVLVLGKPYGPTARSYSVPVHRLGQALKRARAIEKHFTVTDEEVAGRMTANELLAYVREREAPPPVRQATVTADQLRAAGLTEEQIEGVLSATQSN